MNLRCRNCGGGDIVAGEAGARAKCAQCGGTSFSGHRNFGNGTIMEGHGPKHATMTITAHPGVPYASTRRMWDEIHALIDSAPEAFKR